MSSPMHPLDPLSPQEIKAVASIVKAKNKGKEIMFNTVTLKEPVKLAYYHWKEKGGPMPARLAYYVVVEEGATAGRKLLILETPKESSLF